MILYKLVHSFTKIAFRQLKDTLRLFRQERFKTLPKLARLILTKNPNSIHLTADSFFSFQITIKTWCCKHGLSTSQGRRFLRLCGSTGPNLKYDPKVAVYAKSAFRRLLREHSAMS